MNFAAPIALLFLGLSIPVILLYLLKQRRQRVEVSTLLFWDKILRDEQTVTSLTKLRKLLSLFLQLLFIALLAFALARPVMSGKWTGARRNVLFIDASASMRVREGNKTRFDLARDQAAGVIRSMGIGDTLMLVTLAAQPEIIRPFTDGKKDLQVALAALEPTDAEINFRSAWNILELLPPDTRETDVYFVTDGAFEAIDVKPPSNTKFAYLKVGEKSENIGISSFQVRPLPSSPRDFEVHLELVNQTPKEQKVPLELHVGGRLLDAFEFTIPAGETITRAVHQFSARGGDVEAVLVFDDAFPLDNRAYATLPAPRPIRVGLVTEANLFLESALRTDDEVELTMVKPADYKPVNPFEVTIFSGWTPARSPPGSSLFLSVWPEDIDLPRDGVVEKPLFTDWERDHPITRNLVMKNISIDKAARVRPGQNFKVLASSVGDPLLLLRETPSQKSLVVTFDTASSDLPLRVAFPILIANTIRYFSGVDAGNRWQNPSLGQILGPAEIERYAARRAESEEQSITAIVDPAGHRIPYGTNRSLVPVQTVGYYKAETRGGKQFSLFAANLASAVESKIKPSAELPVRTETPLPKIQTGFHVGFEPWFVLVALAFVLSVAEWILFHRRVIE